jgi:3-hydroxymyristoyl/3-hydroxydecanoyl-(acyl carrier protein) dehydratase
VSTTRHPLLIPHAHPSLPGHFPGAPVVPGVVVLDAVLAAAGAHGAQAPRRLVQAKFLAPLLPGQPACIELAREGAKLRFRVLREGDGEGDGALLASGEFALPEAQA